MELSIIIVNWNTRDYLRRCLESIRDNPPACDYEVIVVDNASSDESARMVRENFGSDVKLIDNRRNAGYAEGNNQGIEIAQGEYLVLLNPDTEVKPGSLDRLLAFGRSHPDAAAVGCRLVGPDDIVQSSCRSFPEPLAVLFEYTRLSRIFPRSRLFGAYRMTYFDYAHVAEVDQPMGSCLLLSRKAVEDVGMFDQLFPIFFNEVDWCYRAKENGWKIYFTPDVEIVHHGGASTRQIKPAMILESHRSLRNFYEKHYKKRLPGIVYRFVIAAIAANSQFSSRLRSIAGQKRK